MFKQTGLIKRIGKIVSIFLYSVLITVIFSSCYGTNILKSIIPKTFQESAKSENTYTPSEQPKLTEIEKNREIEVSENLSVIEIITIEKRIPVLTSYDEIMYDYLRVKKYNEAKKNDNTKITNIANDRLKELAIQAKEPIYIDVDGETQNIYASILEDIKKDAVSQSKIAILLDWLDQYRDFSPYDGDYGVPGSEEERHVYSIAMEIEENLILKAINRHDSSIISSYFSDNPYENLPKELEKSFRVNGWQNAELECLTSYSNIIAKEEEKIQAEKVAQEEKRIYDEAIAKEVPSIYTDKYPNGAFDASKIPFSQEKNDYLHAYESIENAKEYLANYPDSTNTNKILKFIHQSEWPTSETYLKLQKNIPLHIQDAQLMVREGVIDLDATFKEYFFNGFLGMQIDFSVDGNHLVVILVSLKDPSTKITIDMTFSSAYNGMLAVNFIEVASGSEKDRVTSFQDKLMMLGAIYALRG